MPSTLDLSKLSEWSMSGESVMMTLKPKSSIKGEREKERVTCGVSVMWMVSSRPMKTKISFDSDFINERFSAVPCKSYS